MDKDEEMWRAAGKQLPWIKVSDLKFWDSPVLQAYKVNSIPVNFLIDKKGVILAKDIRGENLENKLKSIFNE